MRTFDENLLYSDAGSCHVEPRKVEVTILRLTAERTPREVTCRAGLESRAPLCE